VSLEVASRRKVRIWHWLGLAVTSTFLVWQLAAELVEPHLLLVIADWFRPKAPPLEVATVGGTALRLYGDTRPHVGKIAGLQKGLVWVQQGQELIEEGYGLGCPVVESGGRAYVSGHSETAMERQGDVVILTKRYQMDTIDTPVRFLQRKFRRVPSLGVVTVRYEIRVDGTVDVAADLTELQEGWERAYLMNEQGAVQFAHYHDASGVDLNADGIGIWDLASVQQACFDGADGELSFCVAADLPARLYYGREHRRLYNWRGVSSLSWSGIDLELQASESTYEYRITLTVARHP